MAESDHPYRDPSLDAQTRARDLVQRLSLDEKLAQLAGQWGRALCVGDRFDPQLGRRLLGHGIGHVQRLAEFDGPQVVGRLMRDIQGFLVRETRFGIPALFHEEGLAGLMARDAQPFPMPIALAASFDAGLVERIGDCVHRQMTALGVHQVLAPVLDVARDHRWGRCEETYGEDPCVVAALGAAYVRGLQGADRRLSATLKHFVGYAGSAAGLNWGPAFLPQRELLDVHVAPFCDALDAGALSVMNAYQEIDGTPVGANRALLTELLRGELGFQGAVVTDYYTLPSLAEYHNVAENLVEAAALGLKAGLDVELPVARVFADPLRCALDQGRVAMADIDEAVLRVLRQKFAQGLFEQPWPADPPPLSRGGDEALAYEAAVGSLVLLQNRGGRLPLAGVRRVAVIGPHADSRRLLLGDYHFPAHQDFEHGPIRERPEDEREPPTVGIDASAAPTVGAGFGSRTSPILLDALAASTKRDLYDLLPRGPTILEALRVAAPQVQFEYVRGCRSMDAEPGGVDAAVALATTVDVAIVCVGERSGLARRSTSGEASDRATIGLYGPQLELVRAVAATGVSLVLVVVSGRPLALQPIAEAADAILYAWTPGPAGARAIADVLLGRASPRGRLPISLMRDQGQMPYTYAHKPSGGRSQFWGDYADLSAQPLFPFGHGLTYTEFSCRDFALEAAELEATGSLRVTLIVTNIGPAAGSEVVQLYVRDVHGSVTRPVIELRAFVRVSLESRAACRVRFDVPVERMAFTGHDFRYGIEPGAMQVMIGRSSRNLEWCADWRIVGERRIVGRRGRRRWSAVVEPLST